MKNKAKIKNLVKLNPFSLDKINYSNKKPVTIKNANINPKLKFQTRNKFFNENLDKAFFNKTLNNLRNTNLFITKSNSQKKQLELSTNEIYDDIIRKVENQFKMINSENYMQNLLKMFEILQKELINQIEGECDENKMKKILKSNFESITQYFWNFFSFYENKCTNFIISLKKMIKDLISKLNYKSINNNIGNNQSEKSNQIINNYTNNNNNNIIIFDENKKKHFFNEEENIVNLINNLSSNIRLCNKQYKSSFINIANLIDVSNTKLVELKSKLSSLYTNIIPKYKSNFDLKNLNESITDIDNLYSININLIEEVKLIDDNQKSFFQEAKDIFNNLKINHKIKIKEYQKLFESIQNIQTKNDSKSKENNINCYYTINNLSLWKKNNNKKQYKYHNIIGKRGKSLPNEIKSSINELKSFKLNLNINNKSRTRNLSNLLNETSASFNNKSNHSYNNNNNNITNSFNNSSPNVNITGNSFNTTSILQNKNNIFSLKDESSKINRSFMSTNISNKKIKNENDLLYLAEKVMEFLDKMNILQQSIIKKELNVSQQKKDFAKLKKQLVEYIQTIVNNKEYNFDSKLIQNNVHNNNTINRNSSSNSNKISDFLYNKIINEKSNNNISNSNKNNIPNYYFQNEKLKAIHIDDYFIISTNNISLLEQKNKELTIEIEKLKENNKKIIEEKKENETLKKYINKFILSINNFIKESNSNSKEGKSDFNSEYIDEVIKKFNEYTNNMKLTLKKIEEEKDILMKESEKNKLDNDNLKNKNNMNEVKENNNCEGEEKANNKKSKISLVFDTEGDLSFKGESLKNSNNFNNTEDESNKINLPLVDNNTTGSFTNIISSLNKLDNNDLNTNDFVEDNKKIKNKRYDINSNNEDSNRNSNSNSNDQSLNINKEILRYQNNLKNKIKSLEEEVEIQKSKNLNFFIEMKNELYDLNEEKIPLDKYTNLLKLYEKEKETNKILEKKYIEVVEKIHNNLVKYFKKMNFNLESENMENNILTSLTEDNFPTNKNKYNSNNLNFDYSNMKKGNIFWK